MKSLATLAVATSLLVGCQTESAVEPVVSTGTAVTPVAFNVEGAPTAELEVPDMMCQYSCTAKVKEVLTAQTGVKEVKIDFDAKKAIVAVDRAKFDGAAAVAALVDYQFNNTKLVAQE